MQVALVVVALTFLVFLTLVVSGVRAVRRGVRRARRDIRHALSEAALTARAAQPGVIGEGARIRKELRASLDSTRATLRQRTAQDPALTEALGLFEQLETHAGALDEELARLMDGEPDRSRIAARLPELRGRADRIRRSADSLRFAAQDRARRDDADTLEALHQQIDLEASALRHWTPVDRERPAAQTPGVEGAEAPGERGRLPGGLRKRRAQGA
ncbi:hypothetical protein [Streptomyces hoynatensis]|uniref:hypothetical protein n=1 Tax=Streptomyces hoynatensis TaxID=1141874 RepID=UPI00187F88AF|nr:hypothetical protein [Streptomyces hoynatensis]